MENLLTWRMDVHNLELKMKKLESGQYIEKPRVETETWGLRGQSNKVSLWYIDKISKNNQK